MPKKTACPGVPRATELITDQEIAFAHLILSGTMTDRRAAEAVGLNPESAAYIKAKPSVRAYMIEHRAAVGERLVDQEADPSRLAVGRAGDGLRMLNFGRDQILNRLWELATLSHQATRGSIAGQMKALAMIAAIEGLIPDRRLSPFRAQPAAPSVEVDIYEAEWLRKQKQQSAGEEPGDSVAATKTQPAAAQVPDPEPALSPAPEPAAPAPPPPSDRDFDRNQPGLGGSLITQGLNWVPQATGSGFDALSESRQPFSIQKGRFGRRR
jgi:hypothetical protein